ncbi:MAG: ubiquitin family protein [Desulfitobacteriaceae bacterium]
MSRISVRFYSTLVPVTGQREIKWIISGKQIPLLELLEALSARYGPLFREQIFDVEGLILPPTRIAIEGDFLPGKDPVAVQLKTVLSGQTVKIFPPTDGG